MSLRTCSTRTHTHTIFRLMACPKIYCRVKVFTRKDKRPQIERKHTHKRWNVHNGYLMLTQFLPKFIISNQSKWILIKWISLSSPAPHTHTQRTICCVSFFTWIPNWERIKANRNEMNRQGMSAQLFNT